MRSLRAQAQARRRAAPELAREGSPPRVRGKPNRSGRKSARRGITPACAGKTNYRMEVSKCYLGSPPRVRGKQSESSVESSAPGITPACAGKTCRNGFLVCLDWDHPRACGENAAEMLSGSRFEGSPPRMRGKPDLGYFFRRVKGITPAHAGKTRRVARKEMPERDHPRACGENTLSRPSRLRGAGSPPRMRGKRCPASIALSAGRITPAHAGKTFVCG